MSGSSRGLRERRSGRLAELRLYRDILTEAALRPTPPASLRAALGEDSLLSAFVSFGTGEQSHGISGFGVGQESAEHPPVLQIYTRYSNDVLANVLAAELRKAQVPVELYAKVHFAAAGSRPVHGGDSLGHGVPNGASGTMGCVVEDRGDKRRYILTCNHVIADLNGAIKGVTDVWAPGGKHGGAATGHLGRVINFADIDFSGADNDIDAALAEPSNAGDIHENLRNIGSITGVSSALSFGDAVQKDGYSTNHTHGKYRFQINAQVTYDGGSKAVFRDLLGIVGLTVNFAAPGDSGAIVLDDMRRAVGMVIAVASGIDLTLATPIRPVLDHFQVDIV